MRLLAVGDVTSPAGVKHLCDVLWTFRKEQKIDVCIVNGENASVITGIGPDAAEALLRAGADVITGGNHTLRNEAIFRMLDDEDCLLRPANFPAEVPGHGYTVLKIDGVKILVINAMGNVDISPVLDSPFSAIDRILAREAGNYDFAVLDIHAEASGEKCAIAYAYDGKIAAVFGTHTHVQTADAKILPHGTGYITDVGMCGESGGVLGMNPEVVVKRMRTHLSPRFTVASGPVVANGVIFEISDGKCTSVTPVHF